jgi:hypothetical protein
MVLENVVMMSSFEQDTYRSYIRYRTFFCASAKEHFGRTAIGIEVTG